MDNWRVWTSTVVLGVLGLVGWDMWWPSWPDGWMVLALATTLAVAHLLSLIAFDDGTR